MTPKMAPEADLPGASSVMALSTHEVLTAVTASCHSQTWGQPH